MVVLLFVILLIQFFNYWIFEPIAFFVDHILEVRFFPIFALVGFILLFSSKNSEKN